MEVAFYGLVEATNFKIVGYLVRVRSAYILPSQDPICGIILGLLFVWNIATCFLNTNQYNPTNLNISQVHPLDDSINENLWNPDFLIKSVDP